MHTLDYATVTIVVVAETNYDCRRTNETNGCKPKTLLYSERTREHTNNIQSINNIQGLPYPNQI